MTTMKGSNLVMIMGWSYKCGYKIRKFGIQNRGHDNDLVVWAEFHCLLY